MEERPIGVVMRELVNTLLELFKSEVRLAKAEATHNAKVIGRQGGIIGACAVVAWLGVNCLVAALVIGLGEALGGNYWLSALLVGAVFVGVGAMLTLSAVNRIKRNSSMPAIRQSITEDRELLQNKAFEIKEIPTAHFPSRRVS